MLATDAVLAFPEVKGAGGGCVALFYGIAITQIARLNLTFRTLNCHTRDFLGIGNWELGIGNWELGMSHP
jgi:hypothetical protein